MIVKELIEKLKEFDETSLIAIESKEGVYGVNCVYKHIVWTNTILISIYTND